MRKLIVVLLAILFIAPGSFEAGFAAAPDSRISTWDPPGPIVVIGDWNIYQTEEYTNKTIVLRGNLTIHSGGSLDLRNTTIRFDCGEDMEFYGEVLGGGQLIMRDIDGNGSTANDAAGLTSHNGIARYMFYCRAGSSVDISNSQVSYCGANEMALGFTIQTNSAAVSNTSFTNCYAGLNVLSSSPVVENCSFQSIYYGMTLWGSGARIDDCVVSSPSIWGMRAMSSTPAVSGLTVAGGMGGVYLSFSNPDMAKISISSVLGTALHCIMSSPILRDSALSGSTDVNAGWGSLPGLVNTTFSPVKTRVGYGLYVSVGRYADVAVVNATGHPAQNAKITVLDSAGLASWSGNASAEGTARAVERTSVVTSKGVQNRSGGAVYAYADYVNWTEAGSSRMNGSANVTMETSPELEYVNQNITASGVWERANATLILGRPMRAVMGGNISMNNVTMLFDTAEFAGAGLFADAGGCVMAEGCTFLSARSPRTLQSSGYPVSAAAGSSMTLRNSTLVSPSGAQARTGYFDVGGTSFLHSASDAIQFVDASCSFGSFSVELSMGGVSASNSVLTISDGRIDNVQGNGLSAYGSTVNALNLSVGNAGYGAFAYNSGVEIVNSALAGCGNGYVSSESRSYLVGTHIAGCGSNGVQLYGGAARLEDCDILNNYIGIDDGGGSLWVEGCVISGNDKGLLSRSLAPVVANSTLSNTCDVATARGSRPSLLNCSFAESSLLVVDSSYVSVGGFARMGVTAAGMPMPGAMISVGDGFSSAATDANGSAGLMAFCDRRVTADGIYGMQPVRAIAVLANESKFASAELNMSHGSEYALELPAFNNCAVWDLSREVWGDEVHRNSTIFVMGDVAVMGGGRLDLVGCDVRLWNTAQTSRGLWACQGNLSVAGTAMRPLVARSIGVPFGVPITVSPGANVSISGSELFWTPVISYGNVSVNDSAISNSAVAGVYSESARLSMSNVSLSYLSDGIEAYGSRIECQNVIAEHSASSGIWASNCAMELSNSSMRANDKGVYALSSRGNATGVNMSGNSNGLHLEGSEVAVNVASFFGNAENGLMLYRCGAPVSNVEASGNAIGVSLTESAPRIDNLSSNSNYYGIYSYSSAPHLLDSNFDGNQIGIFSAGSYMTAVTTFSSGLGDAMESFIGGGSRAENSFSIPERAKLLDARLTVCGVDLKKSAVTSDPAVQFNAAMWGDTLVYADRSSGSWDICAYNLTVDSDGDGVFNYMEYPHPSPDPAMKKITDDAAMDFDPVIWGTTVVWVRWDDVTGYDIMAHNLTNGTTWIAVSGSRMDLQPAIWGDRLAWSQIDAKYSVFAGNLSGGAEPLSKNSIHNFNPDIYGDRVVWFDYDGSPGGPEYSDIHLFNLTTGKDTLVQALPSQQTLPTIWGDWLAYQDDRKGDTNSDGWRETDIYLYNLLTETESQITFDEQASFAPDLSGDKLVWYWHDRTLDDSLPATIEGWSVLMHNMSTGVTEVLEGETYGDSWPVANGPRVAWSNRTGGSGDIWVYDQRYRGFPADPSLDVGDDGTLEWNSTGSYSGAEDVNSTVLAASISRWLRDTESDGVATIPLRVTSSSTGRVRLLGLNVRYELQGIGERITFTGSSSVGLYCSDSDFRLVNSSFAMSGTEVRSSYGADPELLNCTFAGAFSFGDSQSNVTVMNFLHVLAEDTGTGPLPGARVLAHDNGAISLNDTTGADGRVNWVRLVDRRHNSTGVWENGTIVRVEYPGANFSMSPRNVSMAASHLEVFSADLSPPSHTHESPTPGGISPELRPTISVRVADPSGVVASSIRLYVEGYAVYYNLTPVDGGYNVSYWHEFGFSVGDVVHCRIVARDTMGHLLDYCWNFTVVTFIDIPLVRGWNLLSLPLVQVNTSIRAVLASIEGKWDFAMAYNASDVRDRWKTCYLARADRLNDLKSLDHRGGFWLNISENATLRVYGLPPPPTNILLRAGWNLVGYPTANSATTVAVSFWGTGVSIVESFDPQATYRLATVGPAQVMRPGAGYWVFTVMDAVWAVPL
jgi:beta propeller repeat protein